jgi:ATP synthase protein I
MAADKADEENSLDKLISKIEKRKLNAQKNPGNVWSGLGMFGMVGWSIAIPTLLGVALGIWLDKKIKEPFSWTLTLLFLGLFTGCLIAWHWIDKENKKKDE